MHHTLNNESLQHHLNIQVTANSFFSPLQVKEEILLEALTTRKTVTVGERLIVPYKLAEVTFLVIAAPYQNMTPSLLSIKPTDSI